MYATNYFEDAMLNLLKNTSITAPNTVYLALFMTNPTDTGTAGTEVSYSGYARQAISFSAPVASGSGLAIQNSADITFPESPSNTGAVNYVAVMDAASGGNMWLYGELDETLNIQTGVSPVFQAGNVKWIWTGNLSTYYRTAIMNVMRKASGGGDCPGFSPYVGFCNGDPTGSGSEISGGNYTRQAVTFGNPAQQSSGSDLVQNTNQIATGVATGSWGTVNTVAIFDAVATGHAFAVIPLGTTYNVNSGYSIGIKQGNLQFSVN